MSAVAPIAPGLGHDVAPDTAPSLARLVRVELRKMYDTPSGFWLLAVNLALTILVAGLSAFTGPHAERTFGTVLGNASGVVDFLLPIVGILLVTSEWSQRTGQITFALVPRRGRVLAAKVGAAAALGLVAFAVAVLLSALATAVGPGPGVGGDRWAIDGAVVPQCALYAVLAVVSGIALGAAILRSAPAIVAWFLLPIALVAITTAFHALRPVGDWVDRDALSQLTDHALSGHEWAQVGTNVLVWVVLPLAIGLLRFVRSDVR